MKILSNLAYSFALAIVISVFPASPSAATQPQIQLSPSDILTIQNTLAHYSQHWDNRNIEGFVGLFSEDATVDMGGHILKGQAKLRAFHKEKIEEFERLGLQRRHLLGSISISPTAPDRVVVELYCQVFSTRRGQAEIQVMPPVQYHGILIRTKQQKWVISSWQARPDRPFPVES